MHPTTIEIIATTLFGLAVLHTFAVKYFLKLAGNYPEGSIGENFFHLLGEIEVVFGLWAMLLIVCLSALSGRTEAIHYLESLHFTEAQFVFVVMAIAASRPILHMANITINFLSKLLPLPHKTSFFWITLTVGPLLGSFITEPAAMTVTALLLKDRYFDRGMSEKFKYLTIGTLFVNVSIGGVLTPFAAPPVLMVANVWNWDFAYMMTHFGTRAIVAVLLNATLLSVLSAKGLDDVDFSTKKGISSDTPPAWLCAVYALLLGGVILNAHHAVVFLGIFMMFLGITEITKEYHDSIRIKESLLVAFFLAGLVVLGGFQGWWLSPLIDKFSAFTLFVGAAAMTAVVDNAALTYLGTRVADIPEALKLALVKGAVAGGGLTVIANAPNPAGYSILKSSFAGGGVSPLRLFLSALIPTFIAMLCLWFL